MQAQKIHSNLINIYDFDRTIYNGNSTIDFYIFCVKQKPTLLIFAIKPIITFGLFVLRIKSRSEFKQSFYESFLPHVKAAELIDLFWDQKANNIKDFYLSQKKSTDIIITASPYFLIETMAKKLNFHLIASKVDINTGKLLSENNRDINKMHSLKTSKFLKKDDVINSFYSDSYSDRYLANLATHSYLVKGNAISPFNQYKENRTNFISIDFLRFLFCGTINALSGIIFASIASLFIKPKIAFVIGYILSLISGYFIMSVVTFNNRRFSISRFLKYCAGYIPNFIIQYATILILNDRLKVNHIVDYCISALIAVPLTFLIMKLKVFKKN